MSTLRFTLIQSPLFWEDKTANRQMLAKKINELKGKTEIIVLPEMFTTGFTMHPKQLAEQMDGPTTEWMKGLAAANRVIITGSVIISENDYYYNRLIWMLPNGQYGIYDKRHLFAYAGEDQQYTAGHTRLIASAMGWKINLQICYDLRFPVWSRQQSLPPGGNGGGPEYDVLVYVANWPEQRITAWKALLQARAIENQCYVIGVNRVGKDGNEISYNGQSMVIDPTGEILNRPTGEEAVITIALSKEKLTKIRVRFPFWEDGDPFLLTF